MNLTNECKTLLERKLALLEQMLQVIHVQLEAVRREDEQLLMQQIEKKDQLIQSVNNVDKVLQKIRQEQSCDSQMIALEQKIFKVLQQMNELEKENVNQMQQLKDKIGRMIQQMQQGKKAMKQGYMMQKEQTYGYFLDMKR